MKREAKLSDRKGVGWGLEKHGQGPRQWRKGDWAEKED